MSDYHDADGSPVSLDRLCRDEPQWAASQIARLQERVVELEGERLRLLIESHEGVLRAITPRAKRGKEGEL